MKPQTSDIAAGGRDQDPTDEASMEGKAAKAGNNGPAQGEAQDICSPLTPDAERVESAGADGIGTRVRRKRWWLAGLLSILIPGLGHVYARLPYAGIAWSIGLPSSGLILCSLLLLLPKDLVVIALLCAGILFGMVGWAQAILAARRAYLANTHNVAVVAKHELLRGYFVCMMAWLLLTVVSPLQRFVVEGFKIPSAAMVPTLVPGDHVFVDKLTSYERGDVVVFHRTSNRSEIEINLPTVDGDFASRLIALGGDRVEMRDDVLYVNGQPIPRKLLGVELFESSSPSDEAGLELFVERHGEREIRVARDDNANPGGTNIPLTTVPEGHFIVLGDNRDNANDSRYWGTLPVEAIAGRVLGVYWSRSTSGSGLRLNRIGLDIE